MKMFIIAHSCRTSVVHFSWGEMESFLTCRRLSVEVGKRTEQDQGKLELFSVENSRLGKKVYNDGYFQEP